MDGLRDEVGLAFHAPRDDRAVAAGGPERELCDAGARERLDELHVDPDQLVRAAFGHGHAAFTDFAVAGPRVDRSLPGRSPFVTLRHRWIDLRPRIPRIPLVE